MTLDYLVPAGLIAVDDMRAAILRRIYGDEWTRPLQIEFIDRADAVSESGDGIEVLNVTGGPPGDDREAASRQLSARYGNAAEILREAARTGWLTMQFRDGMSPPLSYWATGAGGAALANGHFQARRMRSWLPYDGQPLFAKRTDFDAWLGKLKIVDAAVPPARESPVAAPAPNVTNGKGRSQDPQASATLKTRIEQVHAAAKGRCDKAGREIELAALAEEIKGTAEYRAGSIRQILNGTYRPAKRLGIGPFKWQPPKKAPRK